ncbi:hypothetical protein KQI38_09050 [Tissierella carlieri]|uniref:DUF2178 domain-containing protein n=1 Tax=Tissierella carlieri TaxID=689904 RepID=A0ABT1SF71_9FIRM|nr:hypothetical protein [Tissierella carlieri]MBU5312172.1 hypothetical protein [Tissierella carlieri]MCQ4925134.1 hypothetical protein [Tissierella carlieri]
MKKFKEKIRIRALWMSAIVIGLAVSYLVLFLNQDKLPKMPSFIVSFHAGVLCGLELLLMLDIFKNVRATRDEKALKKLYIEENDERTIMIMQKTGAMGITICIIGLGVGTIISGFFNEIVFFSLLGATLFTALVKGFFKIYFHYKF